MLCFYLSWGFRKDKSQLLVADLSVGYRSKKRPKNRNVLAAWKVGREQKYECNLNLIFAPALFPTRRHYSLQDHGCGIALACKACNCITMACTGKRSWSACIFVFLTKFNFIGKLVHNIVCYQGLKAISYVNLTTFSEMSPCYTFERWRAQRALNHPKRKEIAFSTRDNIIEWIWINWLFSLCRVTFSTP